MILEICPSADLQLALAEPYRRLTLYAVSHSTGGSLPILAADLTFKIDGFAGQPGADHILSNGDIDIHVLTGEVTARRESQSFVRVTYNEPLGAGTVRPWSVPVRILVHDDLPTVWIGNTHASVMAGTDAFVPTVFAATPEQGGDPGAVFDITAHGFVSLSLETPVDGCAVHPITGRVTASDESAGTTLVVNVDLPDRRVGQLPVKVTPGLRELANEPQDVRDARTIVEELPFDPSETPPRRNILILAEGFARSDEHHFRRVALKMARRLRKRRVHEPFHMLRADYRLWMAFAESPQNGITVTTRINQATGVCGDITDVDPTRRLLQAHDSPFGLAFGRRAGEIPFSPDQTANPPEASVDWQAFERESKQPLKDWRRLPSNRSEWNRTMIEWFSTLRLKAATGTAAADRIGETWGPGGPDQGLVIILVNDEIYGGRFEPGHEELPNGVLFGASSLGYSDRVTLTGTGPQYDHERSNVIGAGNYNARMERTLGAIHELAHGLFLGDEYENTHALPPRPPASVFNFDNLDTHEQIATEGATKWSVVPRVAASSTLASDARVTVVGRIDVVLHGGEGAAWTAQADVPIAALQTRNINRSSAVEARYRRYPAFRAHAPMQAPALFPPPTVAPMPLLAVLAVDGDRVTLGGDALIVDMVFPAGSMLFTPLLDPTGAPMSLVLPGVLASMEGTLHVLHKNSGDCTRPSSQAVTFPVINAAAAGIVEPSRPQQLIGLYEGGGHLNCLVYRPTGECIMREESERSDDKYPDILKFPFCHVCRYVIVNEINPSRHAELDLLYPGSQVP